MLGFRAQLPFEGVRLGPHESHLRKMLIEEDPGDEDRYCIFGTCIVDGERKLIDGIIASPIASKLSSGHAIYAMLVADGRSSCQVTQPESLTPSTCVAMERYY